MQPDPIKPDAGQVTPPGTESHQAGSPPPDMLAAAIEYAEAYKESARSRINVASAEMKLALLRLIAALLGAVVVIVLLLSAWILTMVGIAAALADTLAYPGANVLLLAGINLLIGVGFYFWTISTWRKAWSVKPMAAFRS